MLGLCRLQITLKGRFIPLAACGLKDKAKAAALACQRPIRVSSMDCIAMVNQYISRFGEKGNFPSSILVAVIHNALRKSERLGPSMSPHSPWPRSQA